MVRIARCAGALALLLAGAACVHRPVLNSYRLMRQASGPVLVPPGVARPDLSQRTFVAAIAPGKGKCAAEGGIQLQPAGRKLRVTVDRDALLGERQPGWLAGWSMRVEAQGCIAPGRGQDMANLIVESTPLDPAAASRLLYASFIDGYVELGPWNRLEAHSPILREGTPVDAPILDTLKITGQGYHIDVDSALAPSVIGFETAWYGLERNSGRIGYRFAPLSADRNIQGAVERAAGPATNYFQFPSQAAFFRLFHKSEANDVLAFVIAGSTREDLDRRTKAVGNDPTECATTSGMCLALPRRVGVNPFLAVMVNGGAINVPFPGARVSSAIQVAGVKNPDAVLPRLRVSKLFHGKPAPVEFDPKSGEILNLLLTGGEQISWLDGK